jgi:hypothetical protein
MEEEAGGAAPEIITVYDSLYEASTTKIQDHVPEIYISLWESVGSSQAYVRTTGLDLANFSYRAKIDYGFTVGKLTYDRRLTSTASTWTAHPRYVDADNNVAINQNSSAVQIIVTVGGVVIENVSQPHTSALTETHEVAFDAGGNYILRIDGNDIISWSNTDLTSVTESMIQGIQRVYLTDFTATQNGV